MTITLERLVDDARQTCERHRAEISDRELARRVLESPALNKPGGRLRAALAGAEIAVIAECKASSPVDGRLRASFDPVALALAYEAHGAAAISVLTEEHHFGGSLEHLSAVADAVAVPVLRKDFIVDAYQVREAALAGASAILLIADVLEPATLGELVELAHALRMDALVEIHDEAAAASAVEAGSGLIGVNNRDLRTMRVDVDHALRVAPNLPDAAITVAESGIASAEEVEAMSKAGYDAVLVGSTLVRSDDPGAALAALRGAVA